MAHKASSCCQRCSLFHRFLHRKSYVGHASHPAMTRTQQTAGTPALLEVPDPTETLLGVYSGSTLRLVFTCFQRSLYSSTTASQCAFGARPAFAAEIAIFSPCSSVPVMKVTSRPRSRCASDASKHGHNFGSTFRRSFRQLANEKSSVSFQPSHQPVHAD